MKSITKITVFNTYGANCDIYTLANLYRFAVGKSNRWLYGLPITYINHGLE